MDDGVSCDLRVPGAKEKVRCRLKGSCISFVIHPPPQPTDTRRRRHDEIIVFSEPVRPVKRRQSPPGLPIAAGLSPDLFPGGATISPLCKTNIVSRLHIVDANGAINHGNRDIQETRSLRIIRRACYLPKKTEEKQP